MLTFREFQVREDFADFLVENQIDLKPLIENEEVLSEFLRAAFRTAKDIGSNIYGKVKGELGGAKSVFGGYKATVKKEDAKKQVENLSKLLDELGLTNHQKDLAKILQTIQKSMEGQADSTGNAQAGPEGSPEATATRTDLGTPPGSTIRATGTRTDLGTPPGSTIRATGARTDLGTPPGATARFS